MPAEVAKLLEDLEAFGAPPATIAANRAFLLPKQADDAFLVFPENANAVRAFAALATQWNMVSLSTMDRAEVRQVGLNYSAIEPTTRMAGIPFEGDDFDRLRVMEAEALTAWAEIRA